MCTLVNIANMPSPLPEDQKMKRINVWLPLDLLEFIDERLQEHNQREPYNRLNQSAYIRNLLAAEKIQHNHS